MKLRVLFMLLFVVIVMMILSPGPAIAQDAQPTPVNDEVPTVIVAETQDDLEVLVDLYRESANTYERVIVTFSVVAVLVIAVLALFFRESFVRNLDAARASGLLDVGAGVAAGVTEFIPGDADEIAVASILDRLGYDDLADSLRARVRQRQSPTGSPFKATVSHPQNE